MNDTDFLDDTFEHVVVNPELNFWWADANKRNRQVCRSGIRFWELVIISEGSASYTSGNGQRSLKRNDYLLVGPHTGAHTLEGTGEWASYVVSFEDSTQHIRSDVACVPRKNRQITLPQSGSMEANPVVLELINRLCSFWQKQSITREQAGVLTESLLLLLGDAQVATNRQLDRPLPERVRAYLTDHWNQELYVGQIAGAMGCSTGHLSRLFRHTYNMSMRRMQMEIRIEKACLYINSGMSLHEVAYLCGFSDYYHFLRVFKEISGMTTGEYQASKASDAAH